jgi:hypothetical protein
MMSHEESGPQKKFANKFFFGEQKNIFGDKKIILGIQKKIWGPKKILATRKRLGMHVLLIDVEERNSEKKIRSILGKEKENSI